MFSVGLQSSGTGRDPQIADAVTAAITEARTSSRPFFINCNLNDPHRPFYGSQQAAEIDHDETGRYKLAKELRAEHVEVPSFLENLPDVREEYARSSNSVQRADVTIGKVLAALQATPEAEHTVAVFSADHGMPFPFSKATVYTNGTRTPRADRLSRDGSTAHVHAADSEHRHSADQSIRAHELQHFIPKSALAPLFAA